MQPDLSRLAEELLVDLPWSIVLPAGCGKTELIAAIAASVKEGGKPLLVLTHTNAGVDVIRKRFDKYNVKANQARVFTLDTWAKLFDDHFPLLGSKATVPDKADLWMRTRLRAKVILSSMHIGHVVAATYSAVIVDEYQDCGDVQHELILAMSQYVPTGVFGDPLQGIFDFSDGVVDWMNVEAAFAPKEVNPTPHRWASRNPDLGSWLLTIRPQLAAGSTLDLSTSPIIWRQTTPDLSDERKYCIGATRAAGDRKQVIALRQQPAQCYMFARGLSGKFSVAEEVECKVVKELMVAIDSSDGGKVAAATLKFARDCCTGCPNALNAALVTAYSRGNARNFRSGNSNAASFGVLNNLVVQPTAENVKQALIVLRSAVQRVFRLEAWYVAMQVLNELVYGGSAVKKLEDVRNRSRYAGRRVSKHNVSRTLLVKGQEYDECIILGADGMSARNLYVALSRGIDKVTVFSQQSIITITSY